MPRFHYFTNDERHFKISYFIFYLLDNIFKVKRFKLFIQLK